MNKKYFFLLLILVLASSIVAAQPVTIKVISSDSHSFGPSSPDPKKIKMEEEVREPNPDDIIDAMRKKKQVTVSVWQNDGSSLWVHAVRVRAININASNETVENETTFYYDAKIYDPTSNATYPRRFAHHNGTLYLDWNGWSKVRSVVTVHAPPLPTGSLMYLRKFHELSYLVFIKNPKRFYEVSKLS